MNVVPVDFKNSPNGIVPVDAALYSRVIQYCQENLAEPPDMKTLAKTWAVVESGDNDEIVAVHGVTGTVNRPDIPVFRVTGENSKRATQMLYDRLNSYFADLGWRGHEVFIFISEKEKPEQRCAAWGESLNDIGAVPAERFAVTIR